MEEMESKLGAILGNPDMMAQIMAMAQQLGGTSQTPPAPLPCHDAPLPEGLDMAMIAKLAGMASSANIDNDQQTFLLALQPYLTSTRIQKLRKAMRAAKLASIASGFLGSGILNSSGR